MVYGGESIRVNNGFMYKMNERLRPRHEMTGGGGVHLDGYIVVSLVLLRSFELLSFIE